MDKKTKIELPVKDTMLFIANNILDLNITSSISKAKILDKITDAYINNDNIYKVINLLSYDSYIKLKNIYDAYKNKENVFEAFDKFFSEELVDSCLFVLDSEKFSDGSIDTGYKYNAFVFDELKKIFDSEGTKLALKEYNFERVVKGLLNTYGIMKKEYFITYLNNYLNTNYSYNDLLDKIYTKLSLNTFIERFTINWKNINEQDDFISKIPYTEELGNLAESQKQLSFDYNYHDIDYILDKANMNIEKDYKDIIDNISNLNPNISKDIIVNFIDEVIVGIKEAKDIIRPIVMDCDEEKLEDLIDYLTYVHNELELYSLCGYTPNSLKENKIVN